MNYRTTYDTNAPTSTKKNKSAASMLSEKGHSESVEMKKNMLLDYGKSQNDSVSRDDADESDEDESGEPEITDKNEKAAKREER